MKDIFFISMFVISTVSCQSQTEQNLNQLVGGPCEGCEAIYDYGDQTLYSIDTLPKFEHTEPKLKITGTVFQHDGTTPAEGVILYIYQTNREGIYEKNSDETDWARRHGFIRGWIKTGKDGRYTFYSFRPASYPGRQEPEHIHFTVKEPDKNEYYIEDILFDDDPLLTEQRRDRLRNRGGSGVVLPVLQNDVLTIQRDIILGLNIPNYK